MKYHLVTALLLLAAVVCYFVGFGEGIIPLMIAYVALELTLGVRFGRRRRERRQQAS